MYNSISEKFIEELITCTSYETPARVKLIKPKKGRFSLDGKKNKNKKLFNVGELTCLMKKQ